MKRLFLPIVVLSSIGIFVAGDARAASPVEDVVEHFSRTDRDRSGGLSSTEIGTYGWGRYDADGDGSVSQAEFVGGRNADRQRAMNAGRTERAWLLLDWNNDDFLSGTELDGKWERYDTDGNGRVTRQEFLGGEMPTKKPDAVPAPVDNVPAPAGDADVKAGDVNAADALESLWGKKLAEAKKADLFTFFGLEQLEGAVALQAGTRFDFRPKAAAFRNLVLLQLMVDEEDRVKGGELFLARSFIEHPVNGIFARDIAKSFLSQILPDADRKQVSDLITEVWHGGAGKRVAFDGSAPPRLPNPPTPGYETFLGKRDAHQAQFKVAQLSLRNAEDDSGKLLVITIGPKQSDEPRS